MNEEITILKEGDVVYIPSEDRECVVTRPEVFLKRGLDFVLLYNIHERCEETKLN